MRSPEIRSQVSNLCSSEIRSQVSDMRSPDIERQVSNLRSPEIGQQSKFGDCYPDIHNLKSKDTDSNRYRNLNLDSKEVGQCVSEIQRYWKHQVLSKGVIF